MHPIVVLGDVAQVDARFGLFGDTVLVLMQDRCMVCAKHTISSEIILNMPMVLLGDEAQVKAHFGPFRDCVSVGAT
jgi:hypothetical protein